MILRNYSISYIIHTLSIYVKYKMLLVCKIIFYIQYNIDMENKFEDFESFKKFISNRFAVIRNAHNISARKLSIEMGQSTEYINQIENGRKMPSMEGLFNFCDYFKITIGEFFDSTQIYPVQYKEIIESLNKLDNEELAHISKNIEYIARCKK